MVVESISFDSPKSDICGSKLVSKRTFADLTSRPRFSRASKATSVGRRLLKRTPGLMPDGSSPSNFAEDF
ncbi:hypothetical protein R1flu_003851 [Riccia fluitans]|uniref:Uncharacterized protein n=1 Tax=Riccia fluitans TaxID=41844 RepID=A0ABD1YA49_9MARC